MKFYFQYDFFAGNILIFFLLRFLCILRMHVERIHGVGTTPFVSQGLQTRDINACVILDFKANIVKVHTDTHFLSVRPYHRNIGLFFAGV